MKYSTYTLYTVERVCPFCGYKSKVELRKFQLSSLLQNFKPCKEVLCKRCNQWYYASKHIKQCGKKAKCHECFFQGSAVLKFKKSIQRDIIYSTTYTTSANFNSTSSTYTTYLWDTSATSTDSTGIWTTTISK